MFLNKATFYFFLSCFEANRIAGNVDTQKAASPLASAGFLGKSSAQITSHAALLKRMMYCGVSLYTIYLQACNEISLLCPSLVPIVSQRHKRILIIHPSLIWHNSKVVFLILNGMTKGASLAKRQSCYMAWRS